jgi:hypothetical protein
MTPLKLNGLHGAISQKTIFFITTAAKTSNPTFIRSVDKRIQYRMQYKSSYEE